MPRQIANPPIRGASNNSSFFNTGQPFAPASALLNVMPYDVGQDRPRIGTRPGASPYFRGTFGNGQRVQGCGVVARGKTVSGYTLGTGTDIQGTDGASHTQGAIAGNIWRYEPSWGLEKYAYENVTAAGPYSDTGLDTQPNRSVNAVALSPDGTKLITGKAYNDGSGNTVARVTCRNAATLAVLWSKKLSDTGINRFVNAIACSADWVFVCTNHFLRVYKLSDGSNPPAPSASVYGFNGWSREAIDVKIAPSGTTLYGLFRGSNLGATLASGVAVSAGLYATHFRSGIMKYTIATPAQLAAGTATQVLTQSPLSTQLTNASRYYEGKHNYLRFSEKMPWAPRGLDPTAFALTIDGGFVVTHANAAWGPDSNPAHDVQSGWPADDYAPADGSAGYHNVSAFDAAGNFLWRADGDSIRTESDGDGNLNDLLEPTALAVAVDAAGNIYTAGRRTKALPDTDGTNVFAWDRYGDYLWDSDLGGYIRTLAVLPKSQGIVAGSDRSTDYPGAGASYAQIFELRPTDGAMTRAALDLGNVSALAAIADENDDLIIATDKV